MSVYVVWCLSSLVPLGEAQQRYCRSLSTKYDHTVFSSTSSGVVTGHVAACLSRAAAHLLVVYFSYVVLCCGTYISLIIMSLRKQGDHGLDTANDYNKKGITGPCAFLRSYGSLFFCADAA